MNIKIQIILTIIFCFNSSLYSQDFIGLWEVKTVKVGDKTMTPVAKWFKIKPNKTYTSGNGWLQNSEGTWSFDLKENTYSPKETNGIIDKFGPFKISFAKNNLIWEREEDGMKVTVELVKVDKIPKSHTDKIVGLWKIKKHIKNGQLAVMGEENSDRQNSFFIRWDRKYSNKKENGETENGIWFTNAHRPEITFIQNTSHSSETWEVKIHKNEKELILTGLSESNKGNQKIYTRLNEFPKK